MIPELVSLSGTHFFFRPKHTAALTAEKDTAPPATWPDTVRHTGHWVTRKPDVVPTAIRFMSLCLPSRCM
jgi:hypothetical protein